MKYGAILAALFFSLSFVACGSDDDDDMFGMKQMVDDLEEMGKNTSSSGELTYSVPAGDVQYIVSPEISGKDIPNFKMSMCHVTFWGTTYKYQHNRAKAIIVGIATDPNDPTTFVPVDTCVVWGYKQFTWFDVDLSSYTGDGRYVAFVSNFQELVYAAVFTVILSI